MSTLLAAAIAFLGVCIAWGQWHTARQKLVLDLFEKRWSRIASFKALANQNVENWPPSRSNIIEFREQAVQLRPLFGDDVLRHAQHMVDAMVEGSAAVASSRNYLREGNSDVATFLDSKGTSTDIRFEGLTMAIDQVVYPYLRMDQKLPRPPHEWPAIWLGWLRRLSARIATTDAWKNRPFQKRY